MLNLTVLLQALGVVSIALIVSAMLFGLIKWGIDKGTKFSYTVMCVTLFIFVTFTTYVQIISNTIK